MLRTVTATRYVTPLREGGSLPALVEADDDGTYVVKFRGAGQGPQDVRVVAVAPRDEHRVPLVLPRRADQPGVDQGPPAAGRRAPCPASRRTAGSQPQAAAARPKCFSRARAIR